MARNRSLNSVVSRGPERVSRNSSSIWFVDTWPSQSAVVCSLSETSMSLSVSIVMLSRCRTVVVDAVEGVGDEGGGVGDDEDVADKLGPGDGSLEEISDGGTEDEDEDDEEGQDGSLDIEYERSTVSASNSVSNRLKSSSE
jgi:hypothetical protein